LGFMIVNSSKLSPEKKGALENAHKMIEDLLFSKLPGFQKGRTEFGDKNQRPKARLSFEALVRLIAKEVLEYNNTCWLENYPLSEGMIADNIDPIPTQLRLWMIKNISGKLPKFTPDLIQLELLPTGTALVSQHGITFSDKPGGKELHYQCNLAEDEGWFIDASAGASFEIEVGYHTMWPDRIFIRPNKDLGITKPIPCDLIDNAENRPFFGKPFYQINSHHENYKHKKRETEDQRAQSRAERRAYRDHEVAKAEEYFKEHDDGRGDNARMENMNENTRLEIERLREVNKWDIFRGVVTDSEPKIPEEGNKNQYIPPDDSSELIRKKMQEKLHQQRQIRETKNATDE
jgi:putative transposase